MQWSSQPYFMNLNKVAGYEDVIDLQPEMIRSEGEGRGRGALMSSSDGCQVRSHSSSSSRCQTISNFLSISPQDLLTILNESLV